MQKQKVIWLTGLSGSGKTTLATNIRKWEAARRAAKYVVLDGDDVRTGLCADLKFTDADRHENARRVAHAAKLLADNGHDVIVALITPFDADRKIARSILKDHDFYEVFVSAPLEVCQQRDPKGLYKAQTANLTGIASPFEAPTNPDIILDTVNYGVIQCIIALDDIVYPRK